MAEYYELVADGSPAGQARLGEYEASEEVWLEILRNDPDQTPTVARNMKLPVSILAVLAASTDPQVRHRVVEKLRTPGEVLAMLTEDPDDLIRFFVADHPHTTVETLQALTKDPWAAVRERATRQLRSLGKEVTDTGETPSCDEAEDGAETSWGESVAEGKLVEWILGYLDDDEVQLLPDDPDREWRMNSWAYGVGGNSSTPDEIIAAVHAVVAGLRLRWKDSPLHGLFYVWYDVMAGNLKLSVTSQDPLPFTGRIRVTDDLSEIVDEVMNDLSFGHISWSEHVGVEPVDPLTPVWATTVP